MNDRELLELAAKAAGYKLERFISAVYPYPTVYTVNGKPWNPLTDDGAALRLAVKLHISVEHPDPADIGGGYVKASICKTRYRSLYLKKAWFNVEFSEGGPYAATRRAIVRAAAEIGRKMQEGGK